VVIDFSDLIEMPESKLDEIVLRPREASKITSSRQHVKANGIGNNEVYAPEALGLTP
jgi:hypothetical protein